MVPYLPDLSHFSLYVVNLVGFKPQGCKHKQEHQQQERGQTGADSHRASTLPAALHPLLGMRRERPTGNEIRGLIGALHPSTPVHEVHLWQRVALVTAHGAGPAICVFLRRLCMKEVCACV